MTISKNIALRILMGICFICQMNEGVSQQTVGIFLNDSAAFNGYTLFAPMNSTVTYLIDNCGNEVHSWQSDYLPGAVAYLQENGNLIRTGIATNTFFNAGGKGGIIEEFDWEGNLVWAFEYNSENYLLHHDIEVLPNGNILAIAWERIDVIEAIDVGRDPLFLAESLWPDKIIEIEKVGNNDANIVWEWRAWDHLIQDYDQSLPNYGVISEHPEKIDINYNAFIQEDWLHSNSVDYHPGHDLIMISCIGFRELWIIDHSTSTVEAATGSGGNYGKGGDILYRYGNPVTYGRGTIDNQVFFGQHDTHWLEEGLPYAGEVMVFNNRGGENFNSSVERMSLPYDELGVFPEIGSGTHGPESFNWHYEAPGFSSSVVSGTQIQPNGNVLVCEGVEGRFFELDSAGLIHWEYKSPVGISGPVNQGDSVAIPMVFRAYRYPVDYEAFEGKDMSPGPPIELDPWEYECVIYPEPVVPSAVNEYTFTQAARVRVENPFGSELSLHLDLNGMEYGYNIISTTGRILNEGVLQGSSMKLNTEHWSNGLYILEIMDRTGGAVSVIKLFKLGI